ncbi:hypothetical protein PACILC2_50810 [Paenibacillus cisolokensis]|uniref:Uncharacterized protein n=2 Tax=Paenibacillus cisolokensis TaxID=1658519 RepID=A0ABQ4NEW4_9BACL|nr:hypothetical protein PACILC2_50810 [Paenibacillus cisolokensis]
MLLDGKEPVAQPLAGRMSVAVGCAATESMRSGGAVVRVKERQPWMTEDGAPLARLS